ncbi:uncharacterized protein LOC123203659 [Mangifera indica]|uniref:uncharacterized protein LOC123203659 n=1 Tax=Mangifera indica TaxID=29780 RepID=UPI001CFC4658|nr:uncharacterized protein LOC123203659 [Mangifera indica]
MIFMLSALLFEALSVRFVTAVLGLDWHRIFQAAKDSDMDKINELLKEVELGRQESQHKGLSKGMWLFPYATIFSALTIVLLAFTWTSDG